jgi:hypothetical protein
VLLPVTIFAAYRFEESSIWVVVLLATVFGFVVDSAVYLVALNWLIRSDIRQQVGQHITSDCDPKSSTANAGKAGAS